MSSNTKRSSSTKGSSRKSKVPSYYQASSAPDYYLTEEQPQSGYSYQQPAAGEAYNTYSSSGYYEHAAWKWTCCQCGTGGMSVNNTVGCVNAPHCYHNRCPYCTTWQH